VLAGWRAAGATPEAALQATREQVHALRRLVLEEAGWRRLLRAHANGRAQDAWLATDWPTGFDELLVCAPLCALVRFECARCTIGARQENRSCAHPATVFGRIGAILEGGGREALVRHLDDVESMLDLDARHRRDCTTGRAVPLE
jgi:hypothetical protein